MTIDAAGAQVAIAEKIIEKGGDYFLALKGNQPTLHGVVAEQLAGGDAAQRGLSFFETGAKGHGREAIRRPTLLSQLAPPEWIRYK